MFVIGNFLYAVAMVFNYILIAYMWIIIIRAVLSWVNPDPFNPIVRFIHNVTEPVLYQIRKRVPVVVGGIDLSPIIIILAIYFLQMFLVSTLIGLATRLM